jgi:hypothetical protein
MPGDILLDGLRELLEGSTILTEPADQAQFLSDWHGRNHGAARCVVLPRTTADVAAVVALCARLGVPVFPQGGNTSVNIGSIPSTDGRGIVLSLNRMNRVLSVERSANAMIVEAGCVLASVHEAAASVDRKTLAVTPIIARSKTPQIHAGVVDELIDPVKFPNAYRTGASNRQWENAASGYVIDVLKQHQHGAGQLGRYREARGQGRLQQFGGADDTRFDGRVDPGAQRRVRGDLGLEHQRRPAGALAECSGRPGLERSRSRSPSPRVGRGAAFAVKA